MKTFCISCLLALLAILPASAQTDEIRVGLIGLDTSHVVVFSRIYNDSSRADHVPGARVVAAYKGGSEDIESSWSRVDRFTETLQRDYDVEIVDTIEELCQQVDAIMLTSVDGRVHLEQVRPVIEAGLPVFIDKPIAGSLGDAIEIFRLAEEANVPVFTSSSFRYYKDIQELQGLDLGELKGAISYGPAYLEPTHPDLFWYAVHPAEALYTIMGTGCETVVRTATEDTDVVTGTWNDGRVGTLRGLRNAKTPSRVIAFGTGAVAARDAGAGYAELAEEVVKFFRTGEAPVSAEETIELFAFMEAADESKRRGGTPVSIAETIEKHSK